MKIKIKSQDVEDDGCCYTRIEYSDSSVEWYSGFGNKGKNSSDKIPLKDFGQAEYSFDSALELESKYQEEIMRNNNLNIGER